MKNNVQVKQDKIEETSSAKDKAAKQSTRLSGRVCISMPVAIIVKDLQVSENAKTLAVNPNGCGILFHRPIEVGTQLRLTNKAMEKQVECRVVMCRQQQRTETYEIGLAFEEPTAKFWGIHFPPDDWDPATRKKPGKT